MTDLRSRIRAAVKALEPAEPLWSVIPDKGIYPEAFVRGTAITDAEGEVWFLAENEQRAEQLAELLSLVFEEYDPWRP